jgi:hypothetical protein
LNTGSSTLRFKLADDRMYSIDFSVVNPKNSKLPYSDSLVRKRTSHRTVYFREIALESGEEFSFIENLKDYVVISDPSVYYFEVAFYPEMYKNSEIVYTSNVLSLDIKPVTAGASENLLPQIKSSFSILKPESISPDKVVEQTITARQKSLWEQFFLYIDVEQMLMRDPVRNRKFRTLSAEERIQMIKNYRADLIQSRIDTDIVAVPESFYIEKTLYTQKEGTVSVIQWFKYDKFKEKKRYIYYVRQRDGIWQIYDYNIENLGTE